MESTCPHCGAHLEVAGPGRYACGWCRAPFDVAPGATATGFSAEGQARGEERAATASSAALAAPRVDPTVQAPCPLHPANAAEAVCDRCGDFMCRLCTTPIDGRRLCPRCFDLLYWRGALPAVQREFTLPGLCLGLGVIAVLSACSCTGAVFAVPLGIAGLFVGARALKEHAARPELPHRGYTLCGIAASGLALLLSIAALVALFVLPGLAGLTD